MARWTRFIRWTQKRNFESLPLLASSSHHHFLPLLILQLFYFKLSRSYSPQRQALRNAKAFEPQEVHRLVMNITLPLYHQLVQGKAGQRARLFAPLLGLLLCVNDHLPLPWREGRRWRGDPVPYIAVSTGHRTLFKMFGGCRCFIFNYFHQCWNWKSGVFTCALWLVKACLILVFFANSLCIGFLMPNKCCSQSTWRIWSFSSSTNLLWWNFKKIVIFKMPVSVRYRRSCKWSKTQRGRLRQRLLCTSLKGLQEHMTRLCREKHFIQTASPSSVSLSVSVFKISCNKGTHYCPWGFS